MKILFITPLPPPSTGQSLASQALLRSINKHEVTVVNLSPTSGDQSRYSLVRMYSIVLNIFTIFRHAKEVDKIYFTISESLLGNFKDILIYLAAFPYLNKFVIHLHGGSLKKDVLERSKVIRYINIQFLRKVGYVIISGPSHFWIFDDIVSSNRIKIVYNFYSPDLLLPKLKVEKKFSNVSRIQLLFISSMQEKKGYNKLFDAFVSLPSDIRNNFELHFAGYFKSNEEEALFKEKIVGFNNVFYHGVVSHVQKKQLLHKAHILCLPTMYLEGQPLIILEAYASGCIVMATNPPGISDIFQAENGRIIDANDLESSIVSHLIELNENFINLLSVAIINNQLAQSQFSELEYSNSIIELLTA
jgi:glycosyltransferase involved in cell wall biosynthesis